MTCLSDVNATLTIRALKQVYLFERKIKLLRFANFSIVEPPPNFAKYQQYLDVEVTITQFTSVVRQRRYLDNLLNAP